MRKLTRQEEELAKARARKAGRPYPNPVDIAAINRMRDTRTGRRGR